MKRLSLTLLLTIGSVITAAAQPVEQGQEGELARFLPPAPGERVCYGRTYTKAHMANHPKQTVTDVQFRLTYYQHEADTDTPDGQRNYYFQFTTRLRDKAKPLSALGKCVPQDGRIACRVECDGGGITIRRRDGDRILIDFEESGGRINMSEGCNEDDSFELTPGRDDRSFLLSRLPSSQCPGYNDW